MSDEPLHVEDFACAATLASKIVDSARQREFLAVMHHYDNSIRVAMGHPVLRQASERQEAERLLDRICEHVRTHP